mmetsp:Transcript_23820/g.45298  ORF Transcript_23820/g.45298 Transcript_23820/m.45298 type:complete len:388 (-) Transcript_23820:419-1582(-)
MRSRNCTLVLVVATLMLLAAPSSSEFMEYGGGKLRPFSTWESLLTSSTAAPPYRRKPGWRETCPLQIGLPFQSDTPVYALQRLAQERRFATALPRTVSSCVQPGDFPASSLPGIQQFAGWAEFEPQVTSLQGRYKWCNVVVVTAVYGAQDVVSPPLNVHESSSQLACFVMFCDNATARMSQGLLRGSPEQIWNIEILDGYPFKEPRFNSKIPKLLIQRLFPDALYSIWVDGKLQLQVDPIALLAHHLWRTGAELAVSEHLVRQKLSDEACKLTKAFTGELAVEHNFDQQRVQWISQQLDTYQREGFSPIAGLPDTAILIQRHTRRTNAFGCVWFRQILRFPHGRDQMSFGYSVNLSGIQEVTNVFHKCGYVLAAREIGHRRRTGLVG